MGFVLAGLTSTAGLAHANTTRFYPATTCSGYVATDNNIMAKFKEGCFNYFQGPISWLDNQVGNCGPAVTAVLPITGNTSDTVDFDGVTVTYSNGNMDKSISCTVFVQNAAGTTFQSAAMTSGRATSLTTPLIGSITWSGANLPNAGNPIANARVQTIFCTIPTQFSAINGGENGFDCRPGSYSIVTGYSVNTVQP